MDSRFLGECSNCAAQGESYHWCWVNSTWDYCSMTPGHTSREYKCKDSHPCGYHGLGYLWCYTEGDSWDYCSFIDDTSETQYTFKDEECHSYCDLSKTICVAYNQILS